MSFTTGSQGGEYAHVLKESEMPKHNHPVNLMVKGNGGWPEKAISTYGVMIDNSTKNFVTPYDKVNATDVTAFIRDGLTGESQPHNNCQPYIVTYFWKRTI